MATVDGFQDDDTYVGALRQRPADLVVLAMVMPRQERLAARLARDVDGPFVVVCGGAPVPEPLIKLFNGRGIPINQGYGLTETAPMVTFLGPEFALDRVGSAGTTPVFTDVRLVDSDGAVVTVSSSSGLGCPDAVLAAIGERFAAVLGTEIDHVVSAPDGLFIVLDDKDCVAQIA